MKIISVYAGFLKFGIIHRGTNIYLSEKHERGHVMDHLLLVCFAVTGGILLLYMFKKCRLRFGGSRGPHRDADAWIRPVPMA